MGLVTWTAVFTLASLRDTPEDVSRSIDGLIGADLQRKVGPRLVQAGWPFAEAWPEDHGWHAEATVKDEGGTILASFVTCPEINPETPDERAPKDRWRIVIGLDVGLFPKTKARRSDILRALAGDIEAACRALGAGDIVWEFGGPGTTGTPKAR